MQLVLDQSVFGSANLAGRLLELLSLLAYGRHGLVLEETDTADQLLHFIDVFLNAELRQDYRELIEKFQVDSVWRSGSTPVVVKASDLAELLEDLRQPARVVVEDLVSDGAFIRGLATALGDGRLIAALNHNQLVIEHSGGKGRVPEVVTAKAALYRRVRVLGALLDSDRLIPSSRTESHAIAEQIMATTGITVHVLEYREAENYVPNRCLAAIRYGRGRRCV